MTTARPFRRALAVLEAEGGRVEVSHLASIIAKRLSLGRPAPLECARPAGGLDVSLPCPGDTAYSQSNQGLAATSVPAVVTLRPGRRLTEREVIDACRAHLAGYKKPTSVLFVDALPKNSSGKLLRREVRAPFWTDRDRPIGA